MNLAAILLCLTLSADALAHPPLKIEGPITQELVDDLIGEIALANERGDKTITIQMDTPGGSVFEGFRLAKAIETSPAPVTCVVDGMAASMGFYVLQSCHQRIMTKRSLLMEHSVWAGMQGHSEEFDRMANLLHHLTQSMCEHTSARMHMDAKICMAMVHDGHEWWFSWDEALEAHAVDAVIAGTE